VQAPKAPRPAGDLVFQGHAVETLHDHKGLTVLLADFMEGADVRVIQGGGSLRWENADPRNGGQPDLSERQELGGILEEIHGDVYRDNCRDASRLPTTLRERLGRPVTCS
jgi:hypothetical protein